MQPDVVVAACGARPALPDIPGIDAPHVVQAWELLAGRVGVGRRVAVLGGNAVGLETEFSGRRKGLARIVPIRPATVRGPARS